MAASQVINFACVEPCINTFAEITAALSAAHGPAYLVLLLVYGCPLAVDVWGMALLAHE